MGIHTPNGTHKLRHTDELVAAVTMTASQLAQAVGRFEGDMTAMVRAAVRTAQRAFSELDACDEVIDEASKTGHRIADRLSGLLATDAVAEIPAQLDALEATSAAARSTAATRTLLNRLLAFEEQTERTPPTVQRLSASELPGLPSVYRDDDGFEDLMAMAAREEELAPRLQEAHATRMATVSGHLVHVVRQAVASGFADEAFATDSVYEARQTYALWLQCRAERKRDLG